MPIMSLPDSFEPMGAIFDVDDTLLDNYAGLDDSGLHEYARLLAIREIGEKYGIPELATMDESQNKTVPHRSREHSIEGGIWQLFYEVGIVDTPNINHAHALLQEIATRKHELYEPILEQFGAPLPMACEFVKAVYVLTNGRLAIASGARRQDVEAFLRMSGMDTVFEEKRIITREKFVHAKPDSESFEMAFKTLGIPDAERQHVLAFEDDPKGVASAKQAGLYVCAITSRFDTKTLMAGEHKPDLIRDSFVDFAAALSITL